MGCIAFPCKRIRESYTRTKGCWLWQREISYQLAVWLKLERRYMPIASTVLIREILPLGKYKRSSKLCRKQVKWYFKYIRIDRLFFFILKRTLILVRSYNFYDSIALLFHGRRGNFNVSLRRTFNILRKASLWNRGEKLRSRVKNEEIF